MASLGFLVRRHGSDTSGRPIFTTDYMWSWLEAVKNDPNVQPFDDRIVITQGAFMVRAGGGADASAGFHDAAGCIDFRSFNLTESQIDAFVWACRIRGGAASHRTAADGFTEEHIHVTLGGDRPMSPGAASAWQQYLDGTNGLANHGPDKERRPNPLVLSFTPEDDMPAFDDKIPGTQITFGDALKILPGLERHFSAARRAEVERDKRQNQLIRTLFAGLPAAVAEAVVDELPAEGTSLTPKQLRLAIRTGTTNAIRDVFGSLDETEASP